tara:strand:+ start:810 stop:1178 length:369 start_codon:yes stop_codon:yes gene_type:complete
MANMNLPRVLVDLGYYTGRGTNWGNNATSFSTYEDLALTWPSGNADLKSKEEFEAAWVAIEAEDQAVKYKDDRQHSLSGYNPLADQLDMLYWDIQSGVFGENAKSSTWFMECSGVKERFPKP